MTSVTASEPAVLDVGRIRRQFPILAQTVGGKPLAYLDNAATTQKPQSVLDALAPLGISHLDMPYTPQRVWKAIAAAEAAARP